MNKKTLRNFGGKQVDWDNVKRTAGQPLITIITSTFNAAEDLHWTGDSIRAQTYPFVQWIIVDGASNDCTLSVVKQYEDIIDLWFSEPDDGIYDAWNKALKYAKGDWVQFVGAGDELAEFTTIEQVVPVLAMAHPKHDLVYGNLLLLSEQKREPLELTGEPWEVMKGKWSGFRPKLPMHPEVFHHRSLFCDDEPFDTRFKIAADSHFMLQEIKKKDPLYTDLLIDCMPLGGVSGRFDSVFSYFREVREVSKELGVRPPLLHQSFEFFLLIMKFFVGKVFSPKISFLVADGFRLLCGRKVRWSRK